MTGYLILTLGILCLAASAFILGGAWCAARGRDVGPQPKETPHLDFMQDGDYDYHESLGWVRRVTQDAENVNGRVDTGWYSEDGGRSWHGAARTDTE